MKIYNVSSKYGRSPYQTAAFVEAESPKEAIARYLATRPDGYDTEGIRFKATKSALPSYFWEMADYCRPEFIAK